MNEFKTQWPVWFPQSTHVKQTHKSILQPHAPLSEHRPIHVQNKPTNPQNPSNNRTHARTVERELHLDEVVRGVAGLPVVEAGVARRDVLHLGRLVGLGLFVLGLFLVIFG